MDDETVRKRPNILFITADDMNWDAVSAYGCPVQGTTPNLDRLAAKGVRFEHAHVTISVCQPSRSALMTGRYPHRSGGEGFYRLRYPGVPILPELLRRGEYRIGILGKATHSTPYADFEWDMVHDMQELGMGRNPESYHQHARSFIEDAQKRDQPFFLMANSHDPHRPFYGNDEQEWYSEQEPPAFPPSRTFEPEEVQTPGFLADLPEVRLEVSEYYNSVRRCDDTVGKLLDVLRETGVENETLVLFLSDNGMAFPFAKTNCYLHSTRTPWLARWPGEVAPGSIDAEHFISGIDLVPTLLEAAGIAKPEGMDGRSFLSLLCGEEQEGRDRVFTQFHQTAGLRNYPMRCIQTRRFGYIFNPWSDGTRVFINESQAGRTMNAMKEAAQNDPLVAARVNLFLYRAPEEFYDFANDPDALHNLIDDPDFTSEIGELRRALEGWMEETGDPALEAFRQRESRQVLDSFMDRVAETLGDENQ